MIFMSRNKDSETKEFLTAARKEVGAGLTNVPVWIMQKAGKRIWNRRQNRHWRSTKLGKRFKKKQVEQGKIKNTKPVKSGKIKRKRVKKGDKGRK